MGCEVVTEGLTDFIHYLGKTNMGRDFDRYTGKKFHKNEGEAYGEKWPSVESQLPLSKISGRPTCVTAP